MGNKLMAVAGALASLVLTSTAWSNPNAYLGASAGQAQIEEDFGGGVDLDEEQNFYKVFGGARLGLFGIEAGYVDFGTAETEVLGADVELDLTALQLYGTVNADLGPAGLFAKAGVVNWQADADVDGTALDDDGTDPAYGVGARFDLTDNFALRAEYEVFDVDIDNLSLWSAGVEFSF